MFLIQTSGPQPVFFVYTGFLVISARVESTVGVSNRVPDGHMWYFSRLNVKYIFSVGFKTRKKKIFFNICKWLLLQLEIQGLCSWPLSTTWNHKEHFTYNLLNIFSVSERKKKVIIQNGIIVLSEITIF